MPPANIGECRAEDTDLIIVFTVLGVLMLAGGGYAIYDGLPYLVLERGFTQVIIGTVVAVTGVVVLALARVLSELRRVRLRLEARDGVGPKITRAETPVPPSPLPEISAPAFPDRPAPPEERGRILPAAIGLGAGALAGAAATRAAAGEAERDGRVGTDSVGEHAETEQDEPDLFASHLAEWDRETEREDADRAEAVSPEPEGQVEEEADPEPSILPIAQASEDEPEPVTSEDLAVVVTDRDRPSHIEDTDKPAEDVDPFADLLPPVVESEVDPERAPAIAERANPVPETVVEEPKRVEDEFGALRQSLSQSWTRDDPGARPDPTVPAEDRRLDEAGYWMAPAGGRREPWFEPVLIPPEEGSPASDGEDEAGEVLAPNTEPAIDDQQHEPAIVSAEDNVEPAPQEPEPAAASEEGVVGAYQVGDAYFTIFADGSIKARTKEGDYSFASMEELKAYLASEKSRLGG